MESPVPPENIAARIRHEAAQWAGAVGVGAALATVTYLRLRGIDLGFDGSDHTTGLESGNPVPGAGMKLIAQTDVLTAPSPSSGPIPSPDPLFDHQTGLTPHERQWWHWTGKIAGSFCLAASGLILGGRLLYSVVKPKS